MKRNWYALLILIALAGTVYGTCVLVDDTAAALEQDLRQAYACALVQDYPAARAAYLSINENAMRQSKWLGLLVRRNLLDQLNQTVATLAHYATEDNQADLNVEMARALAQLQQLRRSFIGTL